MASALDGGSDAEEDEGMFGALPSAVTFAEFATPSPTKPRRPPQRGILGTMHANIGKGGGGSRVGGVSGRGSSGIASTPYPDDDSDVDCASIVPAAEEVLGAIERDADALAASVTTLIDNLRMELDSCGGDTLAHLEVHLEASETMHGATRSAVKEASGLVSEVMRVRDEARRLEALAAQVRETRRALEQFEHVANRHLPPPPGVTSSASAVFAQLGKELSATLTL